MSGKRDGESLRVREEADALHDIFSRFDGDDAQEAVGGAVHAHAWVAVDAYLGEDGVVG